MGLTAPFEFPPATGANFTQTIHQKVPPALKPSVQTLPTPFVVAITGASGGLGRAAAEVFAQAGATGLVLSRAHARGPGGDEADLRGSIIVTLVVGSVGNEADAQKLAAAVRDEHDGRLDMLINNAGVVSTHESAWGPFDKIRPDQFEVPMQTNYVGRFLTMQALLPALMASPGGGTVVNVTSICSHLTSPGHGAPGYNISALASNRLTEMAAEVYAGDGGAGPVFYSVHPGAVATHIPVGASQEMFEVLCTEEADLCGAVCLWLGRNRPSWLNGRYISATWDMEELQARKDEIVGAIS
ncbi:hypothetical protein PG997_002612 [Apiospora hydei]|uniref:Uncharacterized protein n=1 Tax=Apiospora hydei TaxID=1337664 RepID=A0ABR1WWV2_9PEZI